MRLWITGGGTREPIDEVRYLGNRSTGSLALALTREASARGADVLLFLAKGIDLPDSWPSVSVVRYESSVDLAQVLESAATRGPEPDAILHLAAVADYAPVPTQGKRSSDSETWTLQLVRTPKLVDAMRHRHPSATLVMFKLETGIDIETLHNRARRGAQRSGADAVFANRLEETGAEHRGWLLAPDSSRPLAEWRGRAAIAEGLIAWVVGEAEDGGVAR